LVVRARLEGAVRELRIDRTRPHKKHVLVVFAAVEAGELDELVGADLYGDRASVALAADEYFDDDLVGCRLIDASAGDVGRVVDVLHYPGQDMLVVGARRRLVPLVAAFIRGVDVGAKQIAVELPDGLLD
jgi:16S rRNA processing protein RimM